MFFSQEFSVFDHPSLASTGLLLVTWNWRVCSDIICRRMKGFLDKTPCIIVIGSTFHGQNYMEGERCLKPSTNSGSFALLKRCKRGIPYEIRNFLLFILVNLDTEHLSKTNHFPAGSCYRPKISVSTPRSAAMYATLPVVYRRRVFRAPCPGSQG